MIPYEDHIRITRQNGTNQLSDGSIDFAPDRDILYDGMGDVQTRRVTQNEGVRNDQLLAKCFLPDEIDVTIMKFGDEVEWIREQVTIIGHIRRVYYLSNYFEFVST